MKARRILLATLPVAVLAAVAGLAAPAAQASTPSPMNHPVLNHSEGFMEPMPCPGCMH